MKTIFHFFLLICTQSTKFMKLHASACNVFFKRGYKKCCVQFCFCWVITLSTIIQEWLLYTIRKWRRKVYLPVPWYVINTLQSFQMDDEFIKISLSGKKRKRILWHSKIMQTKFPKFKIKKTGNYYNHDTVNVLRLFW